MSSEQFATIIEGFIPLLGGLFTTLRGYRITGKKPGESYAYDQYHETHGSMLRGLGIVLMSVGLFQVARGVFWIR